MQQGELKKQIKSRGMSIGFLEKEAMLPRNTLYNHVNGAKQLPARHSEVLKKVLKKYKINLEM